MQDRTRTPHKLVGRAALRWSIGVSTTIALGSAARSAIAQPTPPSNFELTWLAPPGCPTQSEVRNQVELILGGPPRISGGIRLVAHGRVTAPDVDRAWQVELTVTTHSKDMASSTRIPTRTIRAASCGEVAGATAVVLAILIDPEAASNRESPTPLGRNVAARSDGTSAAPPPDPLSPSSAAAPGSPPPSPLSPSSAAAPGSPPPSSLSPSSAAAPGSPPPSPLSPSATVPGLAPLHAVVPTPVDAASVAPPAVAPPAMDQGAALQPAAPLAARPSVSAGGANLERPWHFGLRVALGRGYLPGWAPGLGGDAGGRWPHLRAVIGGFVWAPTTRAIDGTFDQRARFWLYSAHAQVCVPFSIRQWTVGPCAGAELVALRGAAEGAGIVSEPQTVALWSGLLGGMVRRAILPRVALALTVDAFVPARMPRFVLTGTNAAFVHQPGPVGLRCSFGAEFAL